jgi:hypothetical protein
LTTAACRTTAPIGRENTRLSRAELIAVYISALPAGAPCRTPAELQAEAEQAVDQAVATVEALRKAGDLKQFNASYKRYRRATMESGQRAVPYSVFLERRTEAIVRNVATTGRMI